VRLVSSPARLRGLTGSLRARAQPDVN
jgi:hypothetical protein